MGDFIKASTDPEIALSAAATAAAFAIGGPAAGFAVASASGSVVSQRRATAAREVELELAQRQETQAARDREVQRKRRINALLGSQAARAAAAGTALSGSVGNISIESARRASEESLVDDINTRARINALKRNRRTISNVSTLRQATTILRTGERIAARG